MIDPYAFVVIALAGWRLAYMITNEDGPWNVFGEIRKGLQGADMLPEPGSIDKLFNCVYCMAFFVTVYIHAIWLIDGVFRDAVTVVAIWGAATALDMVARRES